LDAFELLAVDGTQHITLYFSPYHARRSQKAPDNLSLVPWSQLNETEKALVKFNVMGTTMCLEDFPSSLPDLIESDSILNQISEAFAKSAADRVRAALKNISAAG
jgi:hypothetical protein